MRDGAERRLLGLGPDKLKTSSSDLEELKTELKSSSLELERSSEPEKLASKPRDLPSELCKLRKEIELGDLKLEVESSLPEKFPTAGQLVHQHDPNSNCKSSENCAECVL